MQTNLLPEIDQEIQFFVNKFVSIGWKQEDSAFITKKTDMVINPNSKNEVWKKSMGVVLYPEYLQYREKGHGEVGTIWTCCRQIIDVDDSCSRPEDNSRLKNIAEIMLDDIDRIGIVAFKDEDAWMQHFCRLKPNKDNEVSMKCYINSDYPEGRWSNHTL